MTSEEAAATDTADSKPWRRPDLILPMVAAAIVLSTTTALLGSNLNQAGDDPYHLASEVQVSLTLDEGRNPFGPIDLQWGLQLFRFYQPLFHLTTASLKTFFGVPIVLSHNCFLVFCFALSPFALAWCYRTLGFGRWAAGAGGLLAITSVAGFGNSFEAYFNTGVVTQSFGAILVPLFVGSFVRMLRGQAGPVPPSVWFALTTVSNAAMAVYATLIGALVFLTNAWSLRSGWKSLSIFLVLSVALTSFWTVPFALNQQRYKPVSDNLIRPRRGYWFGGVTSRQLPRLLFSGRVLDDAKVRPARGVVRSEDDELIDRMNHARTKVPRPPFVTVLCFVGLVAAVVRIGQFPYRFVLAGFALSLLMYLGPDDVGWLGMLPFSSRIQHFRVTYMLELFAFALAGAGAAAVGETAQALCRRFFPGRSPLVAAGATGVLLAAPAYGLFQHVRANAAAQVDLRDMREFDAMTEIGEVARQGSPLRIRAAYAQDMRVHWSYLSIAGLSTACGHWGSVGPTVGRTLCEGLDPPERAIPLSREVGVAYYLTDAFRGRRLAATESEEGRGSSALSLVARAGGNYLLFDSGAAYVYGTNSFVGVIANDAQWMYLARAWVDAERSGEAAPPLPVRIEPGSTGALEGVLREAGAVFVLDPERIDGDDALRARLAELPARRGALYSAGPIDGATSRELGRDESILRLASREAKAGDAATVGVKAGEQRRGGPFEYEVSAPSDAILMLAIQHNPGWRAAIDGGPAEVHPVGPDFVGVFVPQGRHRVRFDWRSTWVESATGMVSFVFWVGVLGYAGLAAARRRRPSEAAP